MVVLRAHFIGSVEKETLTRCPIELFLYFHLKKKNIKTTHTFEEIYRITENITAVYHEWKIENTCVEYVSASLLKYVSNPSLTFQRNVCYLRNIKFLHNSTSSFLSCYKISYSYGLARLYILKYSLQRNYCLPCREFTEYILCWNVEI